MGGQALALVARTFVIGLAVAMPVGAMGVLCIERTLHHGWRSGMATGAGIATADGIYAAIAAFGVTGISSLLVAWQMPLRIVGGIALIALGVGSALQSPTTASVAAEASPGSAPETHAGTGETSIHRAAPGARELTGLYASSVGLTLANPLTIMSFAAIFAGAGLSGLATTRAAAIATAGVAAGSFSWWLALATGIALVRHGVSPYAARTLSRVSGAALAAFGVFAITTVFR